MRLFKSEAYLICHTLADFKSTHTKIPEQLEVLDDDDEFIYTSWFQELPLDAVNVSVLLNILADTTIHIRNVCDITKDMQGIRLKWLGQLTECTASKHLRSTKVKLAKDFLKGLRLRTEAQEKQQQYEVPIPSPRVCPSLQDVVKTVDTGLPFAPFTESSPWLESPSGPGSQQSHLWRSCEPSSAQEPIRTRVDALFEETFHNLNVCAEQQSCDDPKDILDQTKPGNLLETTDCNEPSAMMGGKSFTSPEKNNLEPSSLSSLKITNLRKRIWVHCRKLCDETDVASAAPDRVEIVSMNTTGV